MKTNTEVKQAIARAVKRCGSQQRFAEKVGCSQPTVHRWLKTGVVGPDWVRRVAKIVRLPAAQIRPDIFGLVQA
jgi:DNA-binding transcriptional regulator YdaS (Cro superfamily)